MTRSPRESSGLRAGMAALSVSLLGMLATLAAVPGTAWAQSQGGACLYSCQGSMCSDFSNTTDLCLELRAQCEAYCSGRLYYGAIAYSKPDGAWGRSYDWESRERAEREAMRNCSTEGSACKVALWFYNNCGAVAADGAAVGWGRDWDAYQAKRIALAECAKAGGRKCMVKVWQCSPSFHMHW